MGVRSKYRSAEKAEPDTTVNIAVVHTKPAQSAEEAISNAAAADANASKLRAQVPDDATMRLQRQIEQLRQSEQMQRQHAQTQAQAAAEMQRIHQGELQFLEANPGLKAYPELTQRAFETALQQHQRGTPEFLNAVRYHFNDLAVRHLNRLPEPPPPEPSVHVSHNEEHDMPHYTNYGSTPPEESDEYAPQRRIVSAPVSREGSGYGGSNRQKITLTAAQREAARLSGLSDIEYAKHALKLDQYKRDHGDPFSGR